jgi:hypothetical protein
MFLKYARVVVATGLVLSVASQPQWGQTSGGSYRTGIFPPSVVQGTPIEAAAAMAVPLSPRLVPSYSTADASAGTPTLGDPAVANPYFITNVGALETSIDITLSGDFVAQKTPPVTVGSTGELVIATPGGATLGLASPDNYPDRWTSNPNSATDWTYSAPFDKTTDSFAFDIALDQSGNGYIAVMDRNLLSTNIWGFDSNGNELWQNSKLGANLRLFETYHISLLEAENNIWVPVFSSLSALDPNNIASIGMSVVDEVSGLVSNYCVRNTTNPQNPDDPDLKWNCLGGMTGSAWIPQSQLCPLGCAIILNGYATKTTAAYLYNPPDGPGAPSDIAMFASAAKFIANNDQPNPIVDPWTQRAYWTGTNQRLLDGDSLFQLYCIDTNQTTDANGFVPSCAGFGAVGGQSGATIPPLWPLSGEEMNK